MASLDLIKDAAFLKQMDEDTNKVYYVKVLVLDRQEEPLRAIEGRVTAGSLTIDGSSSMRRAGNITFIAEEEDNDLTDIDNLFSINKKIKILIGFENHIDSVHDNIIWFNQGTYVIIQPSITHNVGSVTISLQIKDKMCLLNGNCGGNLPTSVTFDSYDQQIGLLEVEELPASPSPNYIYKVTSLNGSNWEDLANIKWSALALYSWKELHQNKSGDNIDGPQYYHYDTLLGWQEGSESMVGTLVSTKQRIFDIIQTAVCNFGGEAIEKIIINDVPLELKQSVRFTGSGELYYNANTNQYSLDPNVLNDGTNNWQVFNFNEDCGYVYTDFTYPGELITSIGDNVCSVLDKIIEQLGNYEYYYDVDGNFIFQEKKNYLNNSYIAAEKLMDNVSEEGYLLSSENYYVDFSNNFDSIYTLEDGNALITNYVNNPNYTNIKNDYHIWGKNDSGSAIHYHVVVKEKPKTDPTTYTVECEQDSNGEYTGKIKLISVNSYDYINADFNDTDKAIETDELVTQMDNDNLIYNMPYNAYFDDTEGITIMEGSATSGKIIKNYKPEDWRAMLYMQGLAKKNRQERPDIYEQELLDLFDSIYDMRLNKFKSDNVDRPNDLLYWFDYIEPGDELAGVSVDSIGTRIYSYQQDKITKLYDNDIPNCIVIDSDWMYMQRSSIQKKCRNSGQVYTNVSDEIYNKMSIGTYGYSAKEVARDLLYQYIGYNSTISITSIPIYYLEPNRRITIYDSASGIAGDYVIKSINLPLDPKGTMTISATKALTRV